MISLRQVCQHSPTKGITRARWVELYRWVAGRVRHVIALNHQRALFAQCDKNDLPRSRWHSIGATKQQIRFIFIHEEEIA